MKTTIENLLVNAAEVAVKDGSLAGVALESLELERPEEPSHGEWATSLALRSVKVAKKNPHEIARIIVEHLEEHPSIERVEIAGPGFINFYLKQSALVSVFREVAEKGHNFGRSDAGKGERVQIEYVSANPTGPLHVGHGRWAAIGDSLANIMDFCGYDVTREYYINDQGSQMDVFGASVATRYQQLLSLMETQGLSADEARKVLLGDRERFLDEESEHPFTDAFFEALGENAYGGDYIIELAYQFYVERADEIAKLEGETRTTFFREESYKLQLAKNKETLRSARVEFDVWKSERDFYATCEKDGSRPIDVVMQELTQKDLLYSEDAGATFFKSTAFGDDKDRVIIKTNGEYTYFASDIAYTKDKFERAEHVINILGADHHGYIPRIEAVSEALGHKGQYEVLLGQFVKLLQNGVPLRMSKRRGDFVALDELVQEVGPDATRYTLISKTSNQVIDFDIAEVKKQDATNPVYYVQYAHARACSILRKAKEQNLEPAYSDAILSRLNTEAELEIARKINKFSEFISQSAADRAPFRLTHYASDLAGTFHRFYKASQVISSNNCVIEKDLTQARLAVVQAVKTVLEITLSLIGVEAPEKM